MTQPEPIADLLDRDRFIAWLRSGPTVPVMLASLTPGGMMAATNVRTEQRPMMFDRFTEMANPLARYLQHHGYAGAWVNAEAAHSSPPHLTRPFRQEEPLPEWAREAYSKWRVKWHTSRTEISAADALTVFGYPEPEEPDYEGVGAQ